MVGRPMKERVRAGARWLRNRWLPILVGFVIGLVIGVILGLVYNRVVYIEPSRILVHP